MKTGFKKKQLRNRNHAFFGYHLEKIFNRTLLTGVVLLSSFFYCSLQLFLPEAIAQNEQEAEIAATPVANPDIIGDTLLVDNNQNGVIEIDAFGDSIVRGVGDFTAAEQYASSPSFPRGEAGFPLRIESLVNIPVSNLGVPAERLSVAGLYRFASTIPARRPDIVIISGGSNDAIDRDSPESFRSAVQTMINISRAIGVQPIILTVTPSCCNHPSLAGLTSAYNKDLRDLAFVNQVPLADVQRGFRNICAGNNCFLLNRPEGLHPNIEGYDVMGEVTTATLLGVDIFHPDGPATLEATLGLTAGSVKTKPDPLILP